ncbi:hypothetical protein VE02_08846 [Pseudogymnoascus sp. 03VT05]|nr:hypothetical protein VE02_08846 [Pseudogymnoascus sp. 03VT05]
MISTILLTYRAANGIPSNVADNKRLLRLTVYSKRLFRLFNHAGVFDQQRIDAENPLNPIVREQYQRLAVILFKATVHLNAVLITHLPKFRLLDYFDPAMLNVRVPSSQEIWNASKKDYSQDVNGHTLIGSLFSRDTNNFTYRTLTSISACDFSAGMILGCFNKRQPGEPLLGLFVNSLPEDVVKSILDSLQRAKTLNRKLNGTTQDVKWAKQSVEASIDQIPALAGKVDSAVIKYVNMAPVDNYGDDPMHVSGVLGKRSLKGKNRVTSFHAYPNGVVKFSNKLLPTVQVSMSGTAAAGSASGSASGTAAGAASGSDKPQVEYWTWSAEYNDHYHWNEDGSCVWHKASSNGSGKGK